MHRQLVLCLAALLLVAGSALRASASSYYVNGEIDYFSGPPSTTRNLAYFEGTDSLRVSDRARYESSIPPSPIRGDVYAYAGDGLARLSMTSIYRQDAPRTTSGDSFLILRVDGNARVTITDLIITGPGGGTIATSLNLHLDGTISVGSTASARPDGIFGVSDLVVSSRFNGTTEIGNGYSQMKSVNGSPATTTLESGWLTGFNGNTTLTSSTFNVQLDVPFTIELSLSAEAQAGMYDTEQGSASAVLRFDNTLAFNTEGPVFNLPPGYTANSVSAGIVDNQFRAVPEPSTVALLGGAAIFALLKMLYRRRGTLGA